MAENKHKIKTDISGYLTISYSFLMFCLCIALISFTYSSLIQLSKHTAIRGCDLKYNS